MFLSENYQDLVSDLNQTFQNCADITGMEVELAWLDGSRGYIYFVSEAVIDVTVKKVLWGLTDVEELGSQEEVIRCVLSGNAVLLYEDRKTGHGCVALKIRAKGYPEIGISEARDEQVMRGSNEGFHVSYKTNEVLIRKRIRSARLKMEEFQLGEKTDTGVAVVYMEQIARKEVIDEVKKRLHSINIDGFMDSGVVEQLTDHVMISPFPTYMTTTRPDRAAGLLLEGHVVILVNHSPVALVLPVNLADFIKAADDYFEKWEIVTFVRLLRCLAVFLAVSLPALYISVISFHPEILPEHLVYVLMEARKDVPYPVFMEVMVMELSFELLREAGIRVPGAMGNAIGVVGGLIVGSAAVEASLASPIIVIIVALTAMCSFAIPNTEFSSALRLVKFFLILMAQFYGIFGYLSGLLIILLHMSSLESYGFPYLGPVAGSEVNQDRDLKDFIIRMPYKYMTQRPVFAQKNNRHR